VAFLSGIATATGQRVTASIKMAIYSIPDTDLGNLIRSTETLSNGLDVGVLVICPLVSDFRGLANWQAWQDSRRAKTSAVPFWANNTKHVAFHKF
jgi:hypothetical protein